MSMEPAPSLCGFVLIWQIWNFSLQYFKILLHCRKQVSVADTLCDLCYRRFIQSWWSPLTIWRTWRRIIAGDIWTNFVLLILHVFHFLVWYWLQKFIFSMLILFTTLTFKKFKSILNLFLFLWVMFISYNNCNFSRLTFVSALYD